MKEQILIHFITCSQFRTKWTTVRLYGVYGAPEGTCHDDDDKKREKKKVRDGRKDYILMILCSLVKCLRSPDKLCIRLQNFYDGNNIGGKAISALM